MLAVSFVVRSSDAHTVKTAEASIIKEGWPSLVSGRSDIMKEVVPALAGKEHLYE